jgi:hypothetical protein
MAFIIKTPVVNPRAKYFLFKAQKVMYGGKLIAPGDEIFIFDSENEGGRGLCAKGKVIFAKIAKKKPLLKIRTTPRVTVKIQSKGTPKRRFGREELKPYRTANNTETQTEIAKKFYVQATNKIGGVSKKAAQFLRGYF